MEGAGTEQPPEENVPPAVLWRRFLEREQAQIAPPEEKVSPAVLWLRRVRRMATQFKLA